MIFLSTSLYQENQGALYKMGIIWHNSGHFQSFWIKLKSRIGLNEFIIWIF
jgi:hypothetical protein